MLGGDQPTPLDLKFRVGPFPVRVSPWFWLVIALFGSVYLTHPNYGPLFLLLWVGCAFVSVLIHELGHAVAYRWYGSESAILLYGFGGLAVGYPPSSPAKRIVIALAGPFAQFALAGIVFGTAYLTKWPGANLYATKTFDFLMLINIIWAVINLLPVLPLDGGNVCREVLALARARNPDAGAAAVSVAVAGTLAAASLASMLNVQIPVLEKITQYYRPGLFLTFWVILLAVENYQRYQYASRMRPRYYDDDDDTPPWRR